MLREPLFVADWEKVLMIHYEVNPAKLQQAVPFELDLFDGRAFVSLVAFRMAGMRPRLGGRLGRWLLKSIATHDFLNVRTYVQHGAERGIHFMAEWLSNRLSVALGPAVFGLPYRWGRTDYRHFLGPLPGLEWSGIVTDRASGTKLSYRARSTSEDFCECASGSLSEWLMERYLAFTFRAEAKRFFRVWHRPWKQVTAEAEVTESGLLTNNWPFFAKPG